MSETSQFIPPSVAFEKSMEQKRLTIQSTDKFRIQGRMGPNPQESSEAIFCKAKVSMDEVMKERIEWLELESNCRRDYNKIGPAIKAEIFIFNRLNDTESGWLDSNISMEFKTHTENNIERPTEILFCLSFNACDALYERIINNLSKFDTVSITAIINTTFSEPGENKLKREVKLAFGEELSVYYEMSH